ncbi:hypothetical protein [Helicobacter suis]|uniref:Protein hydE n=1 Tax=Helicobacter suis TaxID=104628 RepID=A0A6J4CYM6_9HELI|nr:hypothetical protein [Helicobacter suis]BCD49564.1 Protein hydE [Helicobacter suis]BCD70616.1 Protein hydE [Helicobacter suis]
MTFAFCFVVLDTSLLGIFDRFLAFHASTLCLPYASILQDKNYSFYIKATENKAQDFATLLSQRLPASLGFSFVKVEALNLECKWQSEKPLEPKIDVLKWQASLEGEVWEGAILHLNYQGVPCALSDLKPTFSEIAHTLKQGQEVCFSTCRGIKALSLKPSRRVMFADLNSLLSLTRIDKTSAQTLASYEKPSMWVCPKEIFKQELLLAQSDQILASLPFDPLLGLLGKFLHALEMPYIFIHESEKEAHLSYQCLDVYPKDLNITPSKKGVILWHGQHSLKHAMQALEKERHVLIHLSFKEPSCFWIKEGNYKYLLTFQIDTSLPSILKRIQQEPKGASLYKNYKKEFKALCETLEQIPPSEPSENLLDLLGVLSQILGLSPLNDSALVFEHARAFLRHKGPRIDFKIIERYKKLYLDDLAPLKTAMSFHLAGVEDATLCFGVLDSLAELLGNFIYDTYLNFSVNRVCLCGDVFLEKVFLDLCVGYFPKECTYLWPPFENPC